MLARLLSWLGAGQPAAPSALPLDPPGAATATEAQPARAALSAPRTRFDECVAVVLHHEGGLVDHPKDPGGITNYGISLRAARGMGELADMDGDRDVDADDIRAMTPAAAKAIYRALYWNVVRGDDLPPGVDLVVFDWAVNAGPLRAARGLQLAVGVAQDGAIGPVTLAAVRRADPVEVIRDVSALRLRHLKSLPTWWEFGRGWQRRVGEVRLAAESVVPVRMVS